MSHPGGKQWYSASTTRDLEPVPWLQPAAVVFLERLLKIDFRVLEHGAGGSTLWLAQRVKQVTAVEHSTEWALAVQKKNLNNVNVIVWNKPSIPELRPPYHLMIVDGEPVENRKLYLDAAESLLVSGGWVVLDNCNRPEFKESRDRLKAVCVDYQEIYYGIGQYLNTEFFKLGISREFHKKIEMPAKTETHEKTGTGRQRKQNPRKRAV